MHTSLLLNPFTPSGHLTLDLIYYSGVLLKDPRVPLGTLTLARVPLELVTLHPDYSPMLFRRLRHYQKVVNVSYLYKKYVCIYACCVNRTEFLVGQASKSSACVMDIIWEELKRNNIDIDKDMLSFYICLDEQLERYDSLNARLSAMCFQPVFFYLEKYKVKPSCFNWLTQLFYNVMYVERC